MTGSHHRGRLVVQGGGRGGEEGIGEMKRRRRKRKSGRPRGTTIPLPGIYHKQKRRERVNKKKSSVKKVGDPPSARVEGGYDDVAILHGAASKGAKGEGGEHLLVSIL